MYVKKTDKAKSDFWNKKSFTRKTWLEAHPEDQWIDDENQYIRKTGYEDDDVRKLMAAICLQACIDYKRASMGRKVWHMAPEVALEELHIFFGSPMFQFFVNRIPISEIERYIKATPDGCISTLWKKKQYSQKIQGLL